jgi:AcrR family transcriptional regulator
MILMEKKESAKSRILKVASDLFYHEGVRAVGIDRIIDESGVAKASFYRNYATKDELVVAYLEYRHQLSMNNVDEAHRKYPDSPVKQLYDLIHGLAARMKSPNYRGCSFMNTAVEFPDTDHPGHKKAVELRQELWVRIEEIAREAGARDPEELAVQLRTLCSGAIMISYMDKSAYNTEHFSGAAQLVIENQFI